MAVTDIQDAKNKTPQKTPYTEVLENCDAGILLQKLTHALGENALAAVLTGKQATLNLSLTIKRIDDLDMVEIAHKITTKKPTANGSDSIEETTKTPFYVGKYAVLAFNPHDQETFEFMRE